MNFANFWHYKTEIGKSRSMVNLELGGFELSCFQHFQLQFSSTFFTFFFRRGIYGRRQGTMDIPGKPRPSQPPEKSGTLKSVFMDKLHWIEREFRRVFGGSIEKINLSELRALRTGAAITTAIRQYKCPFYIKGGGFVLKSQLVVPKWTFSTALKSLGHFGSRKRTKRR